MALRIITPPVGYPITLTEAKQHLRVDLTNTDDDALITLYLAAATAHAEVFCGRAFVPRTLELVIDRFAPQIEIPMPPLISVTSIFYDDTEGYEHALSEATDYVVDNVSQPGWVVAVNGEWPETIDAINAVRIRYEAGYYQPNTSPPTVDIPFSIKAAIMLMMGGWYATREEVVVGTIATKLPFGAEALLRQYRVELAMA